MKLITKHHLFMLAAIALILALITLTIYLDQSHWDKFKTDHNCVIVEKTDGSVAIGTVYGKSSNVASFYTPGKTAWKCDDNITYWK